MVYQSRIPASLPAVKIGPQRQEKLAGPVEWHAPNHVAERGAKENRKQCAGARENHVPERLPDETLNVVGNSMEMPREIKSQSTIIKRPDRTR